MIIRRIAAQQTSRYHENGQTILSLATVNLDPQIYLSYQEMKDRAQSLAHS